MIGLCPKPNSSKMAATRKYKQVLNIHYPSLRAVNLQPDCYGKIRAGSCQLVFSSLEALRREVLWQDMLQGQQNACSTRITRTTKPRITQSFRHSDSWKPGSCDQTVLRSCGCITVWLARLGLPYNISWLCSLYLVFTSEQPGSGVILQQTCTHRMESSIPAIMQDDHGNAFRFCTRCHVPCSVCTIAACLCLCCHHQCM